MNWLRRRRATRERAQFAVDFFECNVLYHPWIVLGESRGLYMAVDEDTFCRWCGNNITEEHSSGCPWTKAIAEWGQISYELER